MNLRSLELQGFKSFPDRTVIRFGEDITAIVGPNGSGKSNISDAIAWVMGEQRTKSLRGAKMEDVIFGGTEKRSAVGFAEATLTLDNSDRALAYEADEVMITRRYYRSGDSEYYINRQSARLRDINELFMDTGLGREGYSNIGQGRIDEILSLKSEDRREVFEEAAGISKYRHRKEETERRLADTDANLLRIGDMVAEVELQLEPLRKQSEQAKQYLALQAELRGVEVAVWLDNLDRLTAAAKKAEEDHASAAFVLEQAKQELEQLYARSERCSELLRQKDGELETARQKAGMLESAHQQMEGQMAVLRGNIANNDGNILRIEEELAGGEARSGSVSAQLAQAKQRVEALEAALEQKRTLHAGLQQELAAMAANAEGLTRRYLELRNQETDLTGRLAGGEADIRALEDGLKENAARLDQLTLELDSGASRTRTAQAELEQSRRALEKARQEVTAQNNTIAGYGLRQKTRAQRRDALDQTVRALTAKLDGVQARAGAYRSMEQGFENYQKSVRLVMQEARRGGLRNIHGPVSSLIRTEDAYTVAIEIALGGAMQRIVVDAPGDGKAAISYLKRTGGGRATFLPLSEIRGRRLRETGLEACRGFVGIAADFVRCKDVYRQIVEDLLGRTVLAEDLDAAIAIAKKYANRFRLVTLDGQVIDPGGAMTGGSVNREAGILSRANELERLTAQEKDLTKQLDQAQSELKEAQRALDEVEFQLSTARDQLREAENQALRLQGLEKQHEIMLGALQEAAAAAQREKESLVARAQSDRERLAARKARQEADTALLERTRRELTALEGSQAAAAEQVAGITEKINAARTEEAAMEAERGTAQAHIRDLEGLRAAMEGDRAQKRQLIDSFRADTARLDGEIAALEIKQKENAAQAASMRAEEKRLLAERAEAEASRTRSEREAQEKNKDIQTMERACSLLEQKRATTELEERQIVDKLWDTYQLTPGAAGKERAQIESAAAGSRRAGELRRKLSGLGTPNLGAIEEYARVNERYTYLTTQRDDVLTAKKDLERIIRDITREMTNIFVTEFGRIAGFFSQTFTEMFDGGHGELLLEDPQAPLTCGIEFRVQPPGKQVKSLTLLSGGEKALVAIALYFAILKVRPTPFCMMDEIDAALDDRNVERFATYLRSLAERTQFIVITHRRGTMEASDVLYGVTMQELGVSKLLRLDMNQMEQYLGIME